jgi:transketolase C-terminal domain/subunit
MPANTPRLEHSADIAVVVVVAVAVAAVASKRVVVALVVRVEVVKPCTPTWQVKNNQRKEREIITL